MDLENIYSFYFFKKAINYKKAELRIVKAIKKIKFFSVIYQGINSDITSIKLAVSD